MKMYYCCEFIAKYLIQNKIPYIIGLPGHGILAFVDAFMQLQDKIKVITVKHEQSAIHLADGFYRATGKPLAVFTSVGPGAINTLVGLGTAFCDSTAVILFTASCPTYMLEKGAIQSIDRNQWNGFMSMVGPVVKRSWQITNPLQLPDVLPRALKLATAFRPGPVHIDLPMDIQAATVSCNITDCDSYENFSKMGGNKDLVEKAADILIQAKRPVLLAGGGVILSDACEELRYLAEYMGIPVVTTLMGKGAFPEDHPLCMFYTGTRASTCGNEITRKADAIISIGCRFAEWTCSSYRNEVTFNIPPTKLVHIDIEALEIGKNYPVDIGIQGDAKSVLSQIIDSVKSKVDKKEYITEEYFREMQVLKTEWESRKSLCNTDTDVITTSKFLQILRSALNRDSIVVGAAGHSQAQLFQEFPVYLPRIHISTGAFSTMGFCIPATIGVKLAYPDRQVVGVMGDGDFLMTCQELATAVQYDLPVVYCILNNFGWLSIRDLQIQNYGKERIYATEFKNAKTGEKYSPDFALMATSFGAHAEKVEKLEEIQPAIKRALDSRKPAVVEILTATHFPESDGITTGWADFPVPDYIKQNKY